MAIFANRIIIDIREKNGNRDDDHFWCNIIKVWDGMASTKEKNNKLFAASAPVTETI